MKMIIKFLLKSIFLLLLLISSYDLYTNPPHWTLISSVNLIFHEAGHAIFFVFGNFIHALGGTLMELLVPIAVGFHFMRQGNRYALGFSMWWLSTALYNIGIYASDAQERSLPLITGKPGTHDWWYLLNTIGIIKFDNVVGSIFFALSIGAVVYSIVIIYLDLKTHVKLIMKNKHFF